MEDTKSTINKSDVKKIKASAKEFDNQVTLELNSRIKLLRDNNIKVDNLKKKEIENQVLEDLAKRYNLSNGSTTKNELFFTPSDQKIIAKIDDFIVKCQKESKTGLIGLRPMRKNKKQGYNAKGNMTGKIEQVKFGRYINGTACKKDITPTPIEKSNIDKVLKSINVTLPSIKAKSSKKKKSNKVKKSSK